VNTAVWPGNNTVPAGTTAPNVGNATPEMSIATLSVLVIRTPSPSVNVYETGFF
jgi:hypothetical protein